MLQMLSAGVGLEQPQIKTAETFIKARSTDYEVDSYRLEGPSARVSLYFLSLSLSFFLGLSPEV